MNPFGSIVMNGQLALAIPVALLAGLVSFASPCILPLVPGYLAYLGGFSDGRTRGRAGSSEQRRLMGSVGLFVLGFAAVFMLTGFVFGTAGFWLNTHQRIIDLIAGILVIALGLVFVGQFSFFQNTVKINLRPMTGSVGALLLGIVFAIGWSPCTGPTLAAIDTLALNGGSAWQGSILALCYALGIGIPFVLIAFGAGWAVGGVAFLRRHIRVINIIGGCLLIAIGLTMVTGVWNEWVRDLEGVLPFVTAV